MAGKSSYADKFYGSVIESAANTLTFGEIMTNISIMEKWAWILHRLEWSMDLASYDEVSGVGDMLEMALTMSNRISSLSFADAAVIDKCQQMIVVETAVGIQREQFPLIRDFTTLPGGGLIIPPRPLYIGVKGTSLANACFVEVRGYYTPIQVSGEAYYDLLDAYRLIQ